MTRKLTLTGLLLLFAALFVWLPEENLPFLDDSADRYFQETTAEAAVAYATVRGVNALVSVLKESQVELSPAGIGLTIAAGQVLDPIDDMTERLSSVVVTALVSLGLQKVLFELTQAVPLKFVALLLLFCCLPVWYPSSPSWLFSTSFMLRICALLVVLGLVLPCSSQLSDSLYRHILQQEIHQAKDQLVLISSKKHELGLLGSPTDEGLLSSFSHSAKTHITQTREIFAHIADNAEDITAALLKLTTMYVSLFLLQVLAIPIAVLWLMLISVNSLFRSPVIAVAFPAQIDAGKRPLPKEK